MSEQVNNELVGPDSGMTASESWVNPGPPAEENVNPLKLVLDRMHGRWGWAVLLGLALAPIFAFIGWRLAPVTFKSTGRIVVQSSLPALIAETPETAQIQIEQEMQGHLQSIRSGRVILESLEDEELQDYLGADRLRLAAEIARNIQTQIPIRSNLILVSFEDEDQRKPAAVVRSVLRAYEKIYAPSPEVELSDKRQRINDLIAVADRNIKEFKRRRSVLFENSRYGITNLQLLIDENVLRIRNLDSQINAINRNIQGIELAAARDGRDSDPDNPMNRIQPTEEDLRLIEPGYQEAKDRVQAYNTELKALEGQLGSQHQRVRRLKASLAAQQNYFTQLAAAATVAWLDGPGQDFTLSALIERRDELQDERMMLRDQNKEMGSLVVQASDIEDDLEREKDNMASYEARITELDNEAESVKLGRVNVLWEEVAPPFAPERDKRALMTVGGGFGGFALGFVFVFLIGTFDRKTYGVRQFDDSRSTLRTLGVVPNMDEVDEEPDTVNLATDCVHRIRARIEARRSPERGYSLMITSPYQGDGKTTLAVSLGWSYAESGYRTVLVDADFIGRSMTHQFGRLREPGLREIVRSGRLNGEVVELGHPNLNLLGVGFDRRVSAANLNAGVLRRVIEALREQFDIIIVDTGPMTASIEALPVASVCDGVVLALRRGRSRARMEECIDDIRGVGADYLGVVLNNASRRDCEQYGSTSRTSVQVLAALEEHGEESTPPSGSGHPLLGKMDDRKDTEDSGKG